MLDKIRNYRTAGDVGGDSGGGNDIGGDSGGRIAGGGVPVVLITDPLDVSFEPSEYNQHAEFPRSAWRPDLLALLVLPEFCETDWRDIDVKTPTPFDNPAMWDEVKALMQDFAPKIRNRLTAEILDQDSGVYDYFAHLLMLKSHQNSLVVIQMALKVGQMVGIFFKNKFNRGRPQQVNPALVPLIPPPGHPSYPSAHSLESHLIALALTMVVPGAKKLLNALAWRIATNREVAGVHFRSDTLAGKDLAEEVITRLAQCKSFQDAVAAAQQENLPKWG